jgi:hypothetical protein
VRMSYANSYENIEKAMDILEEKVINEWVPRKSRSKSSICSNII